MVWWVVIGLLQSCWSPERVVRLWPDGDVMEVGEDQSGVDSGLDAVPDWTTLDVSDLDSREPDLDLIPEAVQPDVTSEGLLDEVSGADGEVSCGDCETLDVAPLESALGEPCNNDDDCVEGFCLDTDRGRFCVPLCLPACPEGWGCLDDASPAICLPITPPTCEDCASARCPEAWCRPVGLEGDFCMAPCLEDSQCPEDFECLAYGESGITLCQPAIESCFCSLSQADQTVPCQVSNLFGTCTGFGWCSPVEGMVDCSATPAGPELCDNQDNDCDGYVDEAFPDKGKFCDGPDEDLCLTGIYTCGPTKDVLVCTGEIKQVETCDGKDNDCDGATDEGFPDLNDNGVADCME